MRRHLPIYAFYLLLTVIMAWPAVREPARILFAVHGDALLTIFSLWWFKTAWLQGLPAEPIRAVAAPFGGDTGGVIERGTIWPGVLLSAAVNETFAFNVLTLITFPLAGVAMYHLALRLTGNRLASAVAGLIYAFCPYHLWKAWAWIPLSNIQWLPLYLLALLDLRSRGRWQDALLAGLWFGVNLLTSYIYGFIATGLTLIYLLYAGAHAYITNGRIVLARRAVLLAAGATAVAAAFTLPVIAPIVRTALTTPAGLAPPKYVWPLAHLYNLTARPADYFLPSDASLLRPLTLGVDPVDTFRGDFSFGLFIGYSALALGGYAVWRWARGASGEVPGTSKVPGTSPHHAFVIPLLITLFISALALSLLPPTVTLALPGLGPVTLKTPSFFAYGLAPWFREYARFGVLVMLAAAALAGYGVAFILPRLARRPGRRALFLGLLALALLTDYGYRRPLDAAPLDTGIVPNVYRWLAEQPGDLIIAEYPVPRASQVSPNYLFYATVHGKRLVSGHGFSQRSALLMPAIWDLTDRQTAAALRSLGVEYVIVHRSFPGFDQWYAALPLPDAPPAGFEPVATFDTADVWRVTAAPAEAVAAPGEGFTLAEDARTGGVSWRLAGEGVLYLVNLTDEAFDVEAAFAVVGDGEMAGLAATLADGTAAPLRPDGNGRLIVGPLRLAPGRLWQQGRPVVMPIVLRVAGKPAAEIGLRDFEVTRR